MEGELAGEKELCFRWAALEVMGSCPYRNISGHLGNYSKRKYGIVKPPREARAEVIPIEGRVEARGEKLESHSHMLTPTSGAGTPPHPCQVSQPVSISTAGNHYLPSPLLGPSQPLDC